MPKKRKETVGKIKKRIQKLLLEIARRDQKICQVGKYPNTGKCGGVTTADHIFNRWKGNTYADPDNILLVCYYHHIWWKTRNTMIYAEIVEKVKGKEALTALRKKSEKKIYSWGIKDWQKKEEELKALLKE